MDNRAKRSKHHAEAELRELDCILCLFVIYQYNYKYGNLYSVKEVDMEIIEIIATIILVLMLVIGAISALLALKKSKGDKPGEPNYRVFYITGLILLPIGIIWMAASFFLDISIGAGAAFLGVGVTYVIIGLAYRDKWRK